MVKKDYKQLDDFVNSSLNYVEKLSEKIDIYLEDKSENFMMNKGSNVEELGYALIQLENALVEVGDKLSFLL